MSSSSTAYRQHLLAALGLLAAGDAFAVPVPVPAPLEIKNPSAYNTGTTQEIDVTGATPGGRVYLVGGVGIGLGPCPTPVSGVCLDLVGAQLLDVGRADGSGVVHFDVFLPSTTPDGITLYLQAVEFLPTPSVSLAVSAPTTHPARVCGELPEVSPRESLSNAFQWMLCAPMPRNGQCPAYDTIPYAYVQDQLYRAAGIKPGTGGGYDATLTCDETTIEDRCCYAADVFEWVVGRPYLVNGQARVAQPGTDRSWSTDWSVELDGLPAGLRARAAARWTETALGEHASIASFARFQLQLLQLGAPADLVAETTRAMADEIQHARDAFAIASALAGTTVAPGPMMLDTSPVSADWEEVLRAAVREGCIAETIAAAQVAEAARRCSSPELAELLGRVAEDEQRHAALAWRFVQWVLTQRPELGDLVRTELSAPLRVIVSEADPDAAWLDTLGLLSKADGDRVAVEVFHDVVRPTALAMLAALPAAA